MTPSELLEFCREMRKLGAVKVAVEGAEVLFGAAPGEAPKTQEKQAKFLDEAAQRELQRQKELGRVK